MEKYVYGYSYNICVNGGIRYVGLIEYQNFDVVKSQLLQDKQSCHPNDKIEWQLSSKLLKIYWPVTEPYQYNYCEL